MYTFFWATLYIPSALSGSFMHPLKVQNHCNMCVKYLRFLVYNKIKILSLDANDLCFPHTPSTQLKKNNDTQNSLRICYYGEKLNKVIDQGHTVISLCKYPQLSSYDIGPFFWRVLFNLLFPFHSYVPFAMKINSTEFKTTAVIFMMAQNGALWQPV